VKLVLFDIDGTLLSASGAGRRAIQRALVDVYGTAGPIDAYDFHGKTDLQIVRDLLLADGLSHADVAGRQEAFFAYYLGCLEQEIGDGRLVRLFPGVAELVETLAATEACVIGLLTGNVEGGARIKLRSTGLWPRFRLGAYGSDDPDRTRLPAVAAERARALVGRMFRGADVVVIGDTPLDVGCGRVFGARCIAVATGRHTVDDLTACSADHVFRDFSDTAQVVTAILDGAPRPSG
jgi:phosphoglycolate phosphatase-like HAD superfamily hydrolase